MTPGQDVHFYLNEDLVVSPAVVLNTHESTDVEVLMAQSPWMPEGSYVWDPEVGGVVKRTDTIIQPEAGHVDLLVHGLVRDYRVYGVPESDEPRAGHWMQPPKA